MSDIEIKKEEINEQTNNQTQNITKEELVSIIKEWLKIENEITQLKQEIKQKTAKKKKLTETMVNVMKKNSIDCFDTNSGTLVYKQKKTKKAITGKFLLAQLEELFKEQPEFAKDITKKLLDSRMEVVKDDIVRKIK